MHNRPMRAAHVFVDETKERGLLLTAAAMLPGGLHTARKHMRGLVMPRQRRIHFFREGDARRKKILDVIIDLAPTCTIYDSSRYSRRQQRETCLQALVADLASSRAQMLVLERDDSILDLDRRLLYRQVHNAWATPNCDISTCGHVRNRCSRSRTPSPGAGSEADTGANVCANSSLRCEFSSSGKLPERAKPGPPTVRKAAGSTSPA